VREYVAAVKLYKIENSSLIDVDRRNVLVKVVDKQPHRNRSGETQARCTCHNFYH